MLSHRFMYMSLWCLTIHEMSAINKITTKIYHVLFLCNCFFGLLKELKVHALGGKLFQKFQQISAFFSNCDRVYFQKSIISTSGECDLKKNSATFVFLYCNINQFNQPIRISFLISGFCFTIIHESQDCRGRRRTFP